MAIIEGTRVTGHIANRAGRTDFTGTVTAVYPTGDRIMANVACDDGVERSARLENVATEAVHPANVASVLGGKTHVGDSGSPVPFPLCTSGSRNTRTRYRNTTQAVTCRECSGILKRRAARSLT